jgi:hypothetical protein
MKANRNRGIPCPTYKFTARDETFPAPAQQIPCPSVTGNLPQAFEAAAQSAPESPD